jgi:hypothetical protein
MVNIGNDQVKLGIGKGYIVRLQGVKGNVSVKKQLMRLIALDANKLESKKHPFSCRMNIFHNF